jgi:hypothetical protein
MSLDCNSCYFSCLDDVDDEVRDRAALYLKTIKTAPLAEKYVNDGMCRNTLHLLISSHGI